MKPFIATRIVMSCMLILALTGCASKPMKTDPNMISKLEAFKKKEKFYEDHGTFYPGIANSSLRPLYTQRINQAADDFKEVVLSGNATDAKYRQKIKIGLARFEDLIDSEDQDRVCHYFEELMDIVGLESSGGLLNEFRYGFNPK